jgi:hypothetical protein
MKSPNLERAVAGDGDPMDRRTVMPQPDRTALLSQDLLAQMFQDPDQPFRRHVPRQLHAASTGISSSLT